MDPIAPLVDALHSEGRLRVWSLVITAFGDLVQHRGGEISSSRLGLLMARVGVEPGALRTALSRLGRDGWLERERKGRLGLYRLSAQGLAQFGPATSRIYAPPLTAPVHRWALAVDAGGIARLCPSDRVPDDALCVVAGSLERISPQYRAGLLTPAHRMALDGLARDLGHVLPGFAPLDAAAARMLLIHRWRRIVLRYSDIPSEIMPSDAPLTDPRAAVAQAYRKLMPGAEAWLDSAADGLGPMPGPVSSVRGRFAEA